MAEKVSKEQLSAAAPVASDESGATELAILHPDRQIRIGRGAAARLVTVHEYGFREGLELRAVYKPFLDALFVHIRDSQVTSIEAVEDVLAAHQEATFALIAKATDLDVDVVKGLSDDDGYLLTSTWWVVNAGFFIRRLIRLAAASQAAPLRAAAGALGGPASITPSSAQATAAHQQTSVD